MEEDLTVITNNTYTSSINRNISNPEISLSSESGIAEDIVIVDEVIDIIEEVNLTIQFGAFSK